MLSNDNQWQSWLNDSTTAERLGGLAFMLGPGLLIAGAATWGAMAMGVLGMVGPRQQGGRDGR
jgi:hypothetical protein